VGAGSGSPEEPDVSGTGHHTSVYVSRRPLWRLPRQYTGGRSIARTWRVSTAIRGRSRVGPHAFGRLELRGALRQAGSSLAGLPLMSQVRQDPSGRIE
jgi:hypothetical protein